MMSILPRTWKTVAASMAGTLALTLQVHAAAPEATVVKPDAAAPTPKGKELLLYCAAGIKPVVEPVVAAFNLECGASVQTQFGGSGTMLANAELSKRGDLFFAADQAFIDNAKKKDLIREVFPVANQKPVLAVRKGNPLKIKGIADLLRTDVKTALATPEAAAVGALTKRTLEATGQWAALEKQVREHGVFKPTVMDLANDLKLNAVDAAIIWDTNAVMFPEIEVVAVPEFADAASLISIAVLKTTEDAELSLKFTRYLTAIDRGLKEFKARGYNTVEGKPWNTSTAPAATP